MYLGASEAYDDENYNLSSVNLLVVSLWVCGKVKRDAVDYD